MLSMYSISRVAKRGDGSTRPFWARLSGCLGSDNPTSDLAHMGLSMNTTTVLTEDLWAALDAVPEAQQTEWYKRLEEAADAASQAMLLDKRVVTEH